MAANLVPDAKKNTHLPHFKTCTFCKRTGFLWYRTKRGKFMLAEPKADAFEPDPLKVHLCGVKQTDRILRRVSNGSVGKYGTRSEKPNNWRRKTRRR